jgi:hypothetical protein
MPSNSNWFESLSSGQLLETGTILQQIRFDGVTPSRVYGLFLDPAMHHAATLWNKETFFQDPEGKRVEVGSEGCTMSAIGGMVEATIQRAVQDRVLVMSWKSAGWKLADDPALVTDLDSTVALTFEAIDGGTLVTLVQTCVPTYPITLPDFKGPLCQAVDLHWHLIYWNPMHDYLGQSH